MVLLNSVASRSHEMVYFFNPPPPLPLPSQLGAPRALEGINIASDINKLVCTVVIICILLISLFKTYAEVYSHLRYDIVYVNDHHFKPMANMTIMTNFYKLLQNNLCLYQPPIGL